MQKIALELVLLGLFDGFLGVVQPIE